MIIPPSVPLDAQCAALRAAAARGGPLVGRRREHRPRRLRARRRRGGASSQTPAPQAEAEFMIGALLQMLRRVPVVNGEGLLVGRELGGPRWA
jgi:D-3-phosphoglycerate dehydrogenase